MVRPRFDSPWTVTALLALALVLVAVASALWGSGDLNDPALRRTLLTLRLGRVAGAAAAGAALAAAGVAVQGLFRNPLASPSILGTTAGASLGGQSALLLLGLAPASTIAQWLRPELLLAFGCLAGALISLVVLLAIVRARDDALSLLLTGFLLSALFLSLSGFALSTALRSYDVGRAVASFALGGVSGTGPRQIAVAVPLLGVGLAAVWLWGRPLDLLLSGEDEATSLGIDVLQLRRWVIVWVALLTAAAVVLAGNVAFVGLVVPHALRPLIGPAHRPLVATSALAGAAFVSGCDLASRVLPTMSEVPLGVITGLVGAPVFLGLLRRARGWS